MTPEARLRGDELLTPAMVATLFGVHPRTVNAWARSGKLTPQHTAGGHRRYPASEVQALLLATPLSARPADADGPEMALARQVAIHLDAEQPVVHTLTPAMVAALDEPGAITVGVSSEGDAVLVRLPWFTLALPAQPSHGHTPEDVARRLAAVFHTAATLLADTHMRRRHAQR